MIVQSEAQSALFAARTEAMRDFNSTFSSETYRDTEMGSLHFGLADVETPIGRVIVEAFRKPVMRRNGEFKSTWGFAWFLRGERIAERKLYALAA